MKKPIIIANWKMNLSLASSISLAKDFVDNLIDIKDKDVVICPSTMALVKVEEIISNSDIKLGAQDVFWQESGAYTGESSPKVLSEIGCEYVIIGHSERREYLQETNTMINKKIDACLDNNLIPILCIGETKDQRHEGLTDNILYRQLKNALDNIHLVANEKIVIAYEPVWAIGSGEVVEAEEAERVFALIQQILIDLYPLTIVKNNVRMIYGGSVNSTNISSFSDLELLSGFLVGGASLKTETFKEIVQAL